MACLLVQVRISHIYTLILGDDCRLFNSTPFSWNLQTCHTRHETVSGDLLRSRPRSCNGFGSRQEYLRRMKVNECCNVNMMRWWYVRHAQVILYNWSHTRQFFEWFPSQLSAPSIVDWSGERMGWWWRKAIEPPTPPIAHVMLCVQRSPSLMIPHSNICLCYAVMETSHKLRRYACKSPYTKHIISPRNQGICMRFTLSAGLIVQLLLFKSNMCLRTTYLTNFLDLIWQGWSRLFQWISRKTTSRFQNSQYVLGHLSNYNHCETGDFFCEKHMTHDRFQHMRLLHHSIPSIGKCNPASIPSRWCRWYTMQIAPNVPTWTCPIEIFNTKWAWPIRWHCQYQSGS